MTTVPYGLFLDSHSLRSSVSVPNLGHALHMNPMGMPPPMPALALEAIHQQQHQGMHHQRGPDFGGGHFKEPSTSSAGSSMPSLTHHSSDSSSIGGMSNGAGPSSEALVRNSSSQSAQSDYSMTNKLAANRALSVEGFPSRTAFRSVHMTYLTKISFRRDKSLVTPAMYDAVAWYLLCRADGREEAIRQLGLEEDTSKGEREREAFKRWCIRTFRLGPGIMPHLGGLPSQMNKQAVLERSALMATTCPGGYSIISVADGRPVAPPAQLYGVLVFCHKRTGHGGRDKTHAFLRKYFANVPKELVQAFIKMCPTCTFKRNRDAPYQDSFDGDAEAGSEGAAPSSPPASAPLVLQSAEQWQMSNQHVAPGLHFPHHQMQHPGVMMGPGHYYPSPLHHKAPGTLTSPPSLAELQVGGTLTSAPSLTDLQSIGSLTTHSSFSELNEPAYAGGPDGLNVPLSGAVPTSEAGGGGFVSALSNAQAQSTYIAPDFNLAGFSGLGGGGGGGGITSGGLVDVSQGELGSGILTPSQFSFLRSPTMPVSSLMGFHGPTDPSSSALMMHHAAAPPESLQQRLTALALSTANANASSPQTLPSALAPIGPPGVGTGAGLQPGRPDASDVDWNSLMAQLDSEFGGSMVNTASSGWSARQSFWRSDGTGSSVQAATDAMAYNDGDGAGEGEIDADATLRE